MFVLRRKFKFADSDTKRFAYKRVDRPVLHQFSVASLHENGIRRLESIQKRAARFIFNKFRTGTSSTGLLLRTQLQPLQTRAKFDTLKILYNILNGTIQIESSRKRSAGKSRLGSGDPRRTSIRNFLDALSSGN